MGNGAETLRVLHTETLIPVDMLLMSSMAAPCPLQPLCAVIQVSAPRIPLLQRFQDPLEAGVAPGTDSAPYLDSGQMESQVLAILKDTQFIGSEM